MENITIQTSQNVLIRQNIASVGERMLACMIDYFVIFVYMMIVSYIIDLISNSSGDNVLIMIFFIPMMFYSFISEITMHGQSLGKKIMKIKVVKIDGSQPTVWNFFIRWIFRIVDITMLYGSVAIVTIIINGKGQRFGDIAAKTTVISLKDKSELNKTIYVETPKEYQVAYPEANMLEEDDIKVVFEVLQHYQNNIGTMQAIEIMKDAAEAVERKIGIKAKENPQQFLRKIIYDFNYIHKKST